MIILEVLVWILLIFYSEKNIGSTLFVGGIIWSSLSFIYERKIWIEIFYEYLRDRIASQLLVFMAMVSIYVCMYAKVGVSCIVFPIVQCLLYQGWRTHKAKTVKNIVYLASFIASLIVYIIIK